MNYLQQMKKMRKKNSNSEFYRRQKNTSSQTKTKSNTKYLYNSQSRNKDYTNIKIRRVDKLLQSEDYDAR